jgi:hypothetical protein
VTRRWRAILRRDGEVRIEVRLDPATLQVERGTSEGLLAFIWPGRSKVVDERLVTICSFGDELNLCPRLEIETQEGLLATEDVDDYSPHVIIDGGRDELRLVFESHFGPALFIGLGLPAVSAPFGPGLCNILHSDFAEFIF